MSILFLIIALLHCVHGLTEYVIYPTNKLDVSTCSQTSDALIKILGNSNVQMYESQRRQTTEFWLVEALEFQQAALSQVPGVRMAVARMFGGWLIVTKVSR